MQESTLQAVNIDMRDLLKGAQALFEAAAKLTGEKAGEAHERGQRMLNMALLKENYQQASASAGQQPRGANAQQRFNAVSAVGLLAGLAMMARNRFGLALSGRERAALEFLQVRTHVLKLALVFASTIAAVWFAVAYCTALVAYLLWESMGWTSLLAMTLGFTALVAGLLFYARSLLRQGQPPVQASAPCADAVCSRCAGVRSSWSKSRNSLALIL